MEAQKQKLVKVVMASGEIVHVPPGSMVYVDGECVPDPTPVEMPLGYERPESLESMMMRLIHQVSRGQADIGEESLDDANDFDVDDDDLLEDTFTDAELSAIMATKEMKEQFLHEQEEKKRVESERASRNSAGGEEDDDVDVGARKSGKGDDVRRGSGKRDSRGAARRDKAVERGGKNRRDESSEDSADDFEGD